MDKVQHFEIPADDMARAKKFYSDVFGWKMEDYPMPGMEYTAIYTTEVDEKTRMPKEVGTINGGMIKRGGPMPLQAPTVAIVVENLDAALEKIQEAGGSIVMQKMPIGEVGFYAYVRDTEGNVMGVWQDIPKAKN